MKIKLLEKIDIRIPRLDGGQDIFRLPKYSVQEAKIENDEAWVKVGVLNEGRPILARVELYEILPPQPESVLNINPIIIRAIEDFLKERKIQEVEKRGTWVQVLRYQIVETEPGRFTHFKKDERYVAIEDDGIWVKFTKSDGKDGFFKINPNDVELIKKG